jgi:hypothetical protein
MKILVPSLMAIALFLSACFNAPQADNALSSAEEGDGWKLLFNGSSLDGWRGYNGSSLEGIWTADAGVMHLVGR